MSRTLTAAILVAALTLIACAARLGGPTEAPAATSPTLVPSPTVVPSPTSVPTEAPTPSPVPTAQGFTPAEQVLVDGIRRGARDCEPVRDDLPAGASAGIECGSDDPAVARVGFYRFPTDEAALEAYLARMQAEGVPLDGVACVEGEGESSYFPHDDGISPMRNGCFINDQGYANFRATLGGGMYIGILGTSADMEALMDFAWLGSQDTPGMPTLWFEPDAPSA